MAPIWQLLLALACIFTVYISLSIYFIDNKQHEGQLVIEDPVDQGHWGKVMVKGHIYLLAFVQAIIKFWVK